MSPPRVVLVDNHDSFTHNVAHALREAGAACEIVTHEAELAVLRAAGAQGFVLGPGPCTPAEAGVTVPLVAAALADFHVPMLGICLGLQALAIACGGRVVRSRKPLHGRRVVVAHDGSGCLAAVPSPVEVVRYNSLTVDEASLAPCLIVTARSADGEIMALRHQSRSIEAVQFHPESWLDGGARALFAAWVGALPSCARTTARAPFARP
jgi:anthranilate synthase/aminodeoxychorismate synthase-like glutamine amidotransferase